MQSKIDFNAWIKRTGEAPVILDSLKTAKSVNRLKAYYINNGWFNAEVSSKVDSLENKKATVQYEVKRGQAYFCPCLLWPAPRPRSPFRNTFNLFPDACFYD